MYIRYTVYIRYFWQGTRHPYGHTRCAYTVMANPTNTCNTLPPQTTHTLPLLTFFPLPTLTFLLGRHIRTHWHLLPAGEVMLL